MAQPDFPFCKFGLVPLRSLWFLGVGDPEGTTPPPPHTHTLVRCMAIVILPASRPEGALAIEQRWLLTLPSTSVLQV